MVIEIVDLPSYKMGMFYGKLLNNQMVFILQSTAPLLSAPARAPCPLPGSQLVHQTAPGGHVNI